MCNIAGFINKHSFLRHFHVNAPHSFFQTEPQLWHRAPQYHTVFPFLQSNVTMIRLCVCNSIVEVMNVHSLYMLLSPVCSARHQTGDIEMICLQKNKSFLVLVYKATLMCELLAPNSQKNVKQKNKSTVFVFMEPNCHFFWWHNVYKWYLGGISLCATHILSRLNGDTSSSSSSA